MLLILKIAATQKELDLTRKEWIEMKSIVADLMTTQLHGKLKIL